MARLMIVCLPDAIIALPAAEDGTGKGSVLIPTRSFNKNATKQPCWIFITSEALETDSEDFNRLKNQFAGFIDSNEYDDDWYMMRLQTVITSAFLNIEAQAESGS